MSLMTAVDPANMGFFSRMGKTPFRKQLAWHIKEEPHAAILDITPGMAEELLRHNEGEDYRNRGLSETTVEKYVSEMQRGWKLTGETIIFSKSGRLLNGQHRLRACVVSGRTFQTFVAFGLDEDAFAFMDIGRKRTAADIFSIHGVPDYFKVSAATFWVWKYHHTKMQNPDAGKGPSPDQLYDYYINHTPGLYDSVTPGTRCKNLGAPSLMVALHYICSQKHAALATQFFTAIATGANLSDKDPALKLRNRLIEERVGGGRLADIYVAAFTVQAWNAMRAKRNVGAFRWRGEQSPNQPFPAII